MTVSLLCGVNGSGYAQESEEPAERPAIAVLGFGVASSLRAEVGSMATAAIEQKLNESGRFKVVERAEISGLLGEIKIGEDGLIDDASRQKLGGFQGADYMVYGRVASVTFNASSIAKEAIITAASIDFKIAEVKTGVILIGQNKTGTYVDFGGDATNAARKAIAEAVKEFVTDCKYHQRFAIKGRITKFPEGEPLVIIGIGSKQGVVANSYFEFFEEVTDEDLNGSPILKLKSLGIRARPAGKKYVGEKVAKLETGYYRKELVGFGWKEDKSLIAKLRNIYKDRKQKNPNAKVRILAISILNPTDKRNPHDNSSILTIQTPDR